MDDFDDQIKQTTKNPWYAVRTFNCQELKISDFLKLSVMVSLAVLIFK